MDPIQDQMSHLDAKVDALHEITEQLRSQIADVLSELKLATGNRTSLSHSATHTGRYSHQSRHHFNGEMEHKDVLMDDNYPESDSQTGDRALAPEVQIQRLTAQLTAAYNRIAALEEQLLSRRVI
ncbi:MAG: hypothetical protein HC772_05540 [Leptolyngbyaceae cyanobacterium CRU_2_3]|nr:hypothetical protein [Leptolyngbyaceae cyanobacterium CRU_2_3]